eukprot:TRINITY_DN18257_c0_g1_i1.p1 TRINITY_DN18257_c0_g1~~TRINITY_DN18257_c0_g1_i1.p1  ORF type:complete len:698 (+),score=247.84 TRINITY_DN18257_c0_g1_i1:48-2141(+)
MEPADEAASAEGEPVSPGSAAGGAELSPGSGASDAPPAAPETGSVRSDVLLAEWAAREAAPIITRIDALDDPRGTVLRIHRCASGADASDASGGAMPVDEVPVAAEHSDKLRAQLVRWRRHRTEQVDRIARGADTAASQVSLAEANAVIERVCGNKAVLDLFLRREEQHRRKLETVRAECKAAAEKEAAAAEERRERTALVAEAGGAGRDGRLAVSVAVLSEGGDELCITREAAAFTGAAGTAASFADALRRLQRYEQLPLGHRHVAQQLQPRADALRAQLQQAAARCRQLAGDSGTALDTLRSAVSERDAAGRSYQHAQETLCLALLALEARAAAELADSGLLPTAAAAESPAKLLHQCRDDLRQVDTLLRRTRQDLSRKEQRGAESGELDALRRDQLSLLNDLERLREHEAVVEVALRERRQGHQLLHRERKRFLNTLRQRDEALRQRDDEIAVLRRARESAAVIRTQLAKDDVRVRMAAISASASPTARGGLPSAAGSPPAATGPPAAGSPRRPQSAPPPPQQRRPASPQPQRPATALQRPQPNLPNTLSPPRCTRRGQQALVSRLYTEALERQERTAQQQRSKQQRLRRSRKMLGPDSVSEVNNRLFYSVPEQKDILARKLRETYLQPKQTVPLSADMEKELVKKMYSDSVAKRAQQHQQLRRKLLDDKEPKFPKFESQEQQRATVLRLSGQS